MFLRAAQIPLVPLPLIASSKIRPFFPVSPARVRCLPSPFRGARSPCLHHHCEFTACVHTEEAFLPTVRDFHERCRHFDTGVIDGEVSSSTPSQLNGRVESEVKHERKSRRQDPDLDYHLLSPSCLGMRGATHVRPALGSGRPDGSG